MIPGVSARLVIKLSMPPILSQGKKCEISKEVIEQLYSVERMTYAEIAEALGVCSATVSNYVTKYKLLKRPVGEVLMTQLAGETIGNWLVTEEFISTGSGPRWKCLCKLCNEHHFVLARSLYAKSSTKCKNCWRRLQKKGHEQLNGTFMTALIKSASVRGIEYNLTPEFLWDLFLEQNRKCALSGIELIFGYKSKGTASVDRIDSKIGYLEGNVQWVHKHINIMKQSFANEQFIGYCVAVAEKCGLGILKG